MLSVPASPHFIADFFRVKAEERCDLEAVLTEQDQFATLPVLPSCPVNTELASRLAGLVGVNYLGRPASIILAGCGVVN